MEITLGERTAETVTAYFEKAGRPEIRAVLPQQAKTLEEALADYQKTLLPGSASYGRTIWANGTYVGDVWCYCMDRNETPGGMVSYCVFDADYWGRGAATQALELFLAELRERFLWLDMLGAFTFSANAASIRVLEKNGFRLAERFTEDGVESAYFQRKLR